MGEVQACWVIKIMVRSSAGSLYQEVPIPPSQPYVPTDFATSVRSVTTATPKPQPCTRKKPGTRPEAAFCSGVSWSLVMNSTDGRDRIRSPRLTPLPRSMSAKARKLSTVETRPPPPDGNDGSRLHCPSAGSS